MVARLQKVQLERVLTGGYGTILRNLSGLKGTKINANQCNCTEEEFYDYHFRARMKLAGDKITVQEAGTYYFELRLKGLDYQSSVGEDKK